MYMIDATWVSYQRNNTLTLLLIINNSVAFKTEEFLSQKTTIVVVGLLSLIWENIVIVSFPWWDYLR